MAGGRAMGRFEAAIGFIGIMALATTLIITTGWNPLPSLTDWLDRNATVSDPAPPWSLRLGGKPERAGITEGGQVVVSMRGRVQAMQPSTGEVLWKRDARWGIPAVDVVVLGDEHGHGYLVVDPRSGAILWKETKAGGVWVYSDLLVDLVCPTLDGCTLRARAHGDGHQVWSVNLPGNGRTLSGGNPDLPDTRSLSGWFDAAASGSPGPAPAVMGFDLDRKIQVVDLIDGARVRQAEAPDRLTRVVVVGGRLLFSHAGREEGACRFSVEAFDYRTGASTWRLEGYDLDTATGAGCEQRRDPLGGGGLLSAIRGDNKPVLLGAADGAEVWVGAPGEKVLATDGSLAVVASADHKAIRVLDLLDGNRVVVTRQAAKADKLDAAVTPRAVLLYDPGPNELVVLSRSSGSVLNLVKTRGTVIGYAPQGIVLVSGRTIGVIPLIGAL